MSDTITFRVHIRVGGNSETASLTQQEIDNGNALDGIWDQDDDVPFTDHVIEVTAPLPPAIRVPDATVVLSGAEPAAVSAREAV